MAIRFNCQCGRVLTVSDEKAGKSGKCPQCGTPLTVPAADDGGIGFAADPHAAIRQYSAPNLMGGAAVLPTTKPAARQPATVTPQLSAAMRGGGLRRHLHWVLLLVLLPLAWSTVHKSADEKQSFETRLEATVAGHPDAEAKVVALFDDKTTEHDKHDLCDVLPDDRLKGALLPDRTWMHWVFAAVSGVGFLTAALVLFPAGHAKLPHLVGIGLMTGTIGIFLLLAFQWLAFHMPFFRGNGAITLVLDLIWLIGQSYRLALGDHGFVLSFLGFTAGVGFCEEACKALPLLVRAAGDGFSGWRSAMLWGLISGIGFGVSEGITYSADSYNGISEAGAYVVRFVSCVGLHGIWAAATGIAIYRSQAIFKSVGHPLEWVGRTLQVVIVPMVLHGLYDTLLKQNYEAWALGVAVVSFGWLAYQIERAERSYANGNGQLSLA